jgi:cytochrome c2
MKRAACLLLTLALLATIGACDPESPESPAAPRARADAAQRERGRLLLAAYGCTACHRIDGMDAPARNVGPPLDRIAANSYIGGLLPNNTDALVRWIMAPRRISPGTAMPDLGVSADEARAMAAYLYSQ